MLFRDEDIRETRGAYDATRAEAFQKAAVPARAPFPYHIRPEMPAHIHNTYPVPTQQWGMRPHIHSTPPVAPIHTPTHPRVHYPTTPRMKSIPLPPQVPGVTNVVLHPALAHCGTALVFDLAIGAPSNAALQWQWQRLSSTAATHPPLPSLSMVSPRLAWGITAHASGRMLRSGVSVADVLSAIWEALGREIDREGFRDWEIMQMGQRERGSRGSGRRNRDRITYRDGMARVELLEGKNMFKGLSVSDMGCDTWVLESA
ncbi:hypothetical protein C8R46DRAFT_1121579 [Mycena filopes]|nr:hypothetical protein C8R46DRAFT_1121579 [Mycena filopes]